MTKLNAIAWALLAVFLLVATPLPSKAGEQAATIYAGRLLELETGSLRPASLIRIENGAIVDIVPAEGIGVPADAIDLSGYTVLPGLIDAHTHLCDNSHKREEWDPWTLSAPAFEILCVVNAKSVLEAGFTTVRNVSEPYYAGLAIRDAIASGTVPGPRVYVSGPMISMTGGHGDWGSWMGPQHDDSTPAEAVADGEDAVRRQTREHIKHGVDWIKVAATGGFSSHGTIPGAAEYTVEEMRAAVEEAGKRGLHVAAHAHGADGISNAVAAGVRSIEHGALMDEDSIRLMKKHDVYLVADLLGAHYDLIETDEDWTSKGVTDGRAEYDAYARRVASAYRAGVQLAFGTDAGATPHGRGAEQLVLMVEAGIAPLDAIRSATLVAAELLGIEERAGSLAVGKWADLIAVEGDPLTDISTLTDVRFVMKEGEVYTAAGRKTANSTPLRPRYSAPGEFEEQELIWLSWSEASWLGGPSFSETMVEVVRALTPHVGVRLIYSNDPAYLGSDVETSLTPEQAEDRLRGILAAAKLDLAKIDLFYLERPFGAIQDPGPFFLRADDGSLAIADFGFAHPDASVEAIDREIAQRLGLPTIRSKLVSEAGSRQSNGRGTLLLVEAVELDRNPGWSRDEIAHEYLRVLGAKKVVWLKSGPREDDWGRLEDGRWGIGSGGHVDEFARFADARTILLAEVQPGEAQRSPIARETAYRMEENLEILERATDQDGRPFRILRVPFPEMMTSEVRYDDLSPTERKWFEGAEPGNEMEFYLPGSYLNFVLANGVVVTSRYWRPGLPESLRETDALARDRLAAAFPGREIVQVDATAMLHDGAGIHCWSRNQPIGFQGTSP